MVCPYDAELFGHWWFEGPSWLEALFRKAAEDPSLRFLSLGEYLRIYTPTPRYPSRNTPRGTTAATASSGSTAPTIGSTATPFKASERMTELAERFPDESGLRERILNQAAREVLLAMCSDWALLMRAHRSSDFARAQVEDAISNFGRIYDMLCANTVSTEWLTRLEKRNNLFPAMNYRIFRKKR